MENICLKTISPDNASKDELESFVALVSRGGEVVRGIETRIKRAHSLTMISRDEKILAVAALKIPYDTYRKKVFKKSGHLEFSEAFKYELGWIYVPCSSRGLGFSSHLVSETLKQASGAPVFATTRTDNYAMMHVLISAGFERCGEAYPSTQNKKLELNLFIWRSS